LVEAEPRRELEHGIGGRIVVDIGGRELELEHVLEHVLGEGTGDRREQGKSRGEREEQTGWHGWFPCLLSVGGQAADANIGIAPKSSRRIVAAWSCPIQPWMSVE